MGARRRAVRGAVVLRRKQDPDEFAAPSWAQTSAMRALAGNRAIATMLDANPTVAAESSHAELEATRAEAGSLGTAVRTPRGSGGTSLRPVIRRSMEDKTGADLSGLRIHTGREAGALANALDAEAVTHRGNIFFAPGRYSPGTAAGNKLLAHEVTHATQHDPGTVHLKRRKMHLDFIRMKRKDTQIARMLTAKALGAIGADKLAEKAEPGDAYGHWWVEVGSLSTDKNRWTADKSYGWWPSKTVSIAETLKIDRVDGALNKGQITPPRDPHHGERAAIEFHPVMEVDDSADYATIRQKVEKDVQSFAEGFKGSWNWRFAWGKNCHTFQDRMKKQLGLHYQKSKDWLQDPNADAKIKALDAAKEKEEFLDRWKPLKGIGDLLMSNLEGLQPDPMVDIDEMLALSPQEKAWILEFIGCSKQTMNYWCGWRWMAKGDSIF